ncbi:MAG TPA: heme ABC transporter ATP-binding protein [Pseudolysinimonas sp.]
MSDPVIEPVEITATDVSVTLDGRPVLTEVTLEVRAGEVLALVGPNGAGKSTLLSVLSGERHPDAGSVTLGDRTLSSYPALELARIRSVLTQENTLSFPFRVREVLEMGRSPWARTPRLADDDRALAAAAQRADVADLLDRRFTELSGGERARVSLGRVLAQDTAIVLLDEPTAALDLRHQEDVLRIARELAAEGRAVVVVLHDLSLAGAVADRVGLMDAGRLVALGPPAEVLTASGLSSVYGVKVEVLERDGTLLVVPLRDDHPRG